METNKKEALKRLSSLENEAKALRKIIEAPEDITARVKTFEDACEVLGISPSITDGIQDECLSPDAKSVEAYQKLIIITRALNEGWTPDWKNSNETKWYPYFTMKSGFGFSGTLCTYSYTITHAGSRLCFKTEALAKYAGQQFESIYNDYLTL